MVSHIYFITFNTASKVINRPGVSGQTTIQNIADVGVYGSNPNLSGNG